MDNVWIIFLKSSCDLSLACIEADTSLMPEGHNLSVNYPQNPTLSGALILCFSRYFKNLVYGRSNHNTAA